MRYLLYVAAIASAVFCFIAGAKIFDATAGGRGGDGAFFAAFGWYFIGKGIFAGAALFAAAQKFPAAGDVRNDCGKPRDPSAG